MIDEERSRVHELYRQEDPARNARTRLPKDASIRFISYRLTEIYFPSHIRRLLDGLDALGWLETNRYGERDSLRERIAFSRAPLGGRAWSSIGTIYQRGESLPLWRQHARRIAERELPTLVEVVELELIQVVPSVTAIGCEFLLRESASVELTRLLSMDYATELEPFGEGGYTILSPENLRLRGASHFRNEIQEQCTALVTGLFPGFFSEQDTAAAFPSAAVYSTTSDVIGLSGTDPSFLNALGVDGHFDTFADVANKVLVRWDPSMRPSSRAVSVIVTEPVASERRLSVESRPVATGTLFAVIALRDALIDIIHEFGELRDRLSAADDEDLLPDEKTIRDVEHVLASLTADLRPIVSELQRAKADKWIDANLPALTGLNQKFNPGTIDKGLSRELAIGASYLDSVQRDLSASVQTMSSLVSARAARQLAHSNKVLQRIALIIAVGSLMVSAAKLFIQ